MNEDESIPEKIIRFLWQFKYYYIMTAVFIYYLWTYDTSPFEYIVMFGFLIVMLKIEAEVKRDE